MVKIFFFHLCGPKIFKIIYCSWYQTPWKITLKSLNTTWWIFLFVHHISTNLWVILCIYQILEFSVNIWKYTHCFSMMNLGLEDKKLVTAPTTIVHNLVHLVVNITTAEDWLAAPHHRRGHMVQWPDQISVTVKLIEA